MADGEWPESLPGHSPSALPMPIKFRCPHCEQFLGISRSKAGAVTDCPMCGRTIRVPQLDGTIVPLPKPTLNHGDSGLAKALDALASLGAADSTVEADEEISRPSKPEAIVLAPAPMIEAVLLPVPLPPEPVSHAGSNGGSSRPVPLRQDTARASNRTQGPLDELAAMQLPSRQRASSPGDQKRQPLLVGVLCGVLGLAAGFWIGRVTGSSSPTETAPVVVKEPVIIPPGPALPPTAGQGGAPASVSQTGDLKRAIEGRVTYVNAGGESRPESGARILAVPALHSGLTKLAVEGFRAGASAVDVRV